MVLKAQSNTKNYIRAKSELQQDIKPQTLKSTKSVMTQIYTKHTNTNIKHKTFEELVPSPLPLLKKKHIRLGYEIKY